MRPDDGNASKVTSVGNVLGQLAGPVRVAGSERRKSECTRQFMKRTELPIGVIIWLASVGPARGWRAAFAVFRFQQCVRSIQESSARKAALSATAPDPVTPATPREHLTGR